MGETLILAGVNTTLRITRSLQETGLKAPTIPLQKAVSHKESHKLKSSFSLIKTVILPHSHPFPNP